MSEIRKRGTTQHLQLISTFSKQNRDRSNIRGGNLHGWFWFKNHIVALHCTSHCAMRPDKSKASLLMRFCMALMGSLWWGVEGRSGTCWTTYLEGALLTLFFGGARGKRAKIHLLSSSSSKWGHYLDTNPTNLEWRRNGWVPIWNGKFSQKVT